MDSTNPTRADELPAVASAFKSPAMNLPTLGQLDRLPLELRNMVYSFVDPCLADEVLINEYAHSEALWFFKTMPLRLTSKTIYIAFLHYFIARHRFVESVVKDEHSIEPLLDFFAIHLGDFGHKIKGLSLEIRGFLSYLEAHEDEAEEQDDQDRIRSEYLAHFDAQVSRVRHIRKSYSVPDRKAEVIIRYAHPVIRLSDLLATTLGTMKHYNIQTSEPPRLKIWPWNRQASVDHLDAELAEAKSLLHAYAFQLMDVDNGIDWDSGRVGQFVRAVLPGVVDRDIGGMSENHMLLIDRAVKH